MKKKILVIKIIDEDFTKPVQKFQLIEIDIDDIEDYESAGHSPITEIKLSSGEIIKTQESVEEIREKIEDAKK